MSGEVIFFRYKPQNGKAHLFEISAKDVVRELKDTPLQAGALVFNPFKDHPKFGSPEFARQTILLREVKRKVLEAASGYIRSTGWIYNQMKTWSEAVPTGDEP